MIGPMRLSMVRRPFSENDGAACSQDKVRVAAREILCRSASWFSESDAGTLENIRLTHAAIGAHTCGHLAKLQLNA